MTFWASAISTSQPSCSSVSWTSRAPVIDSTTAQTGSAWTSSIRRASLLSKLDVRWVGELVEVLSRSEKTDVELSSTEVESSVQHVSWASLVRLVHDHR